MVERLIDSIEVSELFGLYSYTMPQQESFSSAAILYGDNGAGKTTVLRLAYHLLSTAHNRGHRSALGEILFKKLKVTLESGIVLTAERLHPEDNQFLTLQILDKDKVLAEWISGPNSGRYIENDGEIVYLESYEASSSRHILSKTLAKNQPKPTYPTGEKIYLAELAKHAPTVFLLNAERRLAGDSVPDPSEAMEARSILRHKSSLNVSEIAAKSREIVLSQALTSASEVLKSKAVIGANKGSTNVQTVYETVLEHLVQPQQPISESPSTEQELLKRLNDIERKTREYAHHELATPLSMDTFKKVLNTNANNVSVSQLLRPYIESVESRLEALQPLYRIIDRFVGIINSHLKDKKLIFKLTKGFSIENSLNVKLESGNLSSGEQQLLLLFCYVLTNLDKPSVFMIDEPEISLNIKWQRKLVQSLLDITEEAKVQFIFASHSMELLTQHKDRVVKLENKNA